MAEVDVPETRGGPRERRAPSARDANVLRRVLRGQPAPVEGIVERGHGLAQLPDARHRRVLLIVHRDFDALDARRRAGKVTRLRLALAEVAPLRVGRRKPALLGLVGHVYDARSGDRTKRAVLVRHSPWGAYPNERSYDRPAFP